MASDSSRPTDAAESAQVSGFDDLVARSIDVLDTEGPAALEQLLDRHGALASAVRRRLATLSKHGLLHGQRTESLERVGPYRILERLGAGGMGEVHLAEHVDTGQRVALKLGPTPAPDLTDEQRTLTERSAERFDRETRAVAAIHHPAIVPIVDRGEHAQRRWFAMEYVEGVGLDRLLDAVRASGKEGEALTPVDFATLVGADAATVGAATWLELVGRVILQVADALAEAHTQGVVHRDVKPSNILVDFRGSARLVDFGLAHLAEMPTLTLSGEFAGTPYYVAPEQIANVRDGIDGRADVFALGVTLYESVSLTKPFAGRTPAEVLAAITGREPAPLRRVAPHLPHDLEVVCRRALEKDPQQRYPNMAAFAEDLRRLLSFRPLLTKPPSPWQTARRWARRRPWRAASLALAGILLVGAPIGLLAANAKIRQQRDRVVAESVRKGAVVEHLVGHFDRSGATADATVAARELLARGVERLEGDFSDQPRVRAALLHASGRAYLNLGLAAEARPLLDRSFALWQRAGDEGQLERSRVLADIARIHLLEGRPGIARDIGTRALGEVPEAGAGSRHLDRARATIAAAHAALGEAALAREELQRIRVVPESDQGEVAGVWEAIAAEERAAGSFDAARGALRRALVLHRSAWTPDPAALSTVHDALAEIARRLEGEGSPEAIDHAAQAARIRDAGRRDLEPAMAAAAPEFPFHAAPPWQLEYSEAFDRAIAALIAERHAEAREHFEKALSHRPIPAVAAYNLACVSARLGESEDAIHWLERAHREGFACAEERAHALRHDSDLDSVRGSSGGERALRALEEQWRDAQAFAERSVLRVPGAAASAVAKRPLLVVLHPDGGVAAEEAEAGWLGLAERVNATLLVPSAPYLSGARSADGCQWSPDPRALFDRPDAFVRPVLEQVRGVLAKGGVDRDRVWIAGRGIGALLALEILSERPGLFRGGLLVDPVLHERSGGGSGALPAALGNRLGVVVTEAAQSPYRRLGDTAAHAAALSAWLADRGGWAESVRVQRAPLWNQAAPGVLDWIRSE